MYNDYTSFGSKHKSRLDHSLQSLACNNLQAVLRLWLTTKLTLWMTEWPIIYYVSRPGIVVYSMHTVSLFANYQVAMDPSPIPRAIPHTRMRTERYSNHNSMVHV